jgi:hypothetical protein
MPAPWCASWSSPEGCPDAERPNLGNFVQRQMVELAALPAVGLEIVAPVDTRRAGPPRQHIPEHEVRHCLTVQRPRYTSP